MTEPLEKTRGDWWSAQQSRTATTPLKLALYIAWMAAFGLFVGLILYQGLGDIAAVLTSAGWGLLWVAGFHVAPLVVDAIGWRALLPGRERSFVSELSWMRWISESINSLLPVAQVGGDLVRIRLLNRAGVPGATAAATVIVDTTAGLLSLIVFALLGIALLLHEGGAAQAAAQLTIGIVILGIISVGFFLAQRAGIILKFARLVEHASKDGEWRALTGGATALNRSVVCLYRRPRAIMVACGWRLVGWLLGTGEVWLALYFLGQPVGLSEALILESMVQALRAAAFAIPGALGVQETGFVLLGGMLGLNPETALALSLVKRVRELALGLPGLVVWQITEGHRIWRQQMPES